MAIHDKVAEIRKKRIAASGKPIPDKLQGVTKGHIRGVLGGIDLGGNNDLIDCAFALLDNETDSWLPKAPKEAMFADGASTANLDAGCAASGDQWNIGRI